MNDDQVRHAPHSFVRAITYPVGVPVASVFAGMPAKPLHARDRSRACALSEIEWGLSDRGKRSIGVPQRQGLGTTDPHGSDLSTYLFLPIYSPQVHG